MSQRGRGHGGGGRLDPAVDRIPLPGVVEVAVGARDPAFLAAEDDELAARDVVGRGAADARATARARGGQQGPGGAVVRPQLVEAGRAGAVLAAVHVVVEAVGAGEDALTGRRGRRGALEDPVEGLGVGRSRQAGHDGDLEEGVHGWLRFARGKGHGPREFRLPISADRRGAPEEPRGAEGRGTEAPTSTDRCPGAVAALQKISETGWGRRGQRPLRVGATS